VPLRYLATAQAAFLLAVTAAVFSAADLADHYYLSHTFALTHLITLGWISMTIMGAAYQLVPVALEAQLYSERIARWQYWLMLLGVTGMVAHFWIGYFSGMAWSAGLVFAAAALFGWNMGVTLWRLPRWGIVAKHVAAAAAFFLAVALVGNLMALDKVLGFWRGEVMNILHAHAHLAALGWATMIIFGVAYRLIPMFALAADPDERLPTWQFWIFTAGTAGLYPAVLLGSRLQLLFGLLAAGGIGLFVHQVAQIAHGGRKPVLDWGVRTALTAVAYLAALVPVGLAFAAGLVPEGEIGARLAFAYGFLGLVGWVSLTIIGMTHKIVPFLVWFHRYSDLVGTQPVPALHQLYSEAWQRRGFWLLHAGILGTAVGLLAASPWGIRGGLAILAAGAWIFALNMLSIYRHLWRRPPAAAAAPAAARAPNQAVAPGR
jgi:cbb3-type cytochrome oxidase subunit 1